MEISLLVDEMFSLDTESDLREAEIVPRLSLPLLMEMDDGDTRCNRNYVYSLSRYHEVIKEAEFAV